MRPIDADELLEQLEDFRTDKEWRNKRTLTERWLRTTGIDIFALAVKKFPAVDAVEVVRCKDCREWCYEYEDVGLCTTDVPDIDGVQRSADDFCSYGERKADER